MPRVSVVIPCRDGAEFLGEALASVRAQTRAPDEVIVVDDRSTDGSAAVARAAGATVLATTEPGGTAVARNIGWRHASGELIAFLDADDRWRPRHLEVVAPLLQEHPQAVLAFGSIEFFGLLSGRYEGHVLANGAPVDAAISSAITCPVPQMTVIVPRGELEAVGGYDERLKAVEDFDLFARLARKGPFVGTPEVTGEYRQHAAQTTRDRRRQVYAENIIVRARSVEALRGSLDASDVALLERRLREIWDLELREAWWGGVQEEFDNRLAARTLVPGSRRLARTWTFRRFFFWHAWIAVRRYGRGFKDSRFWTPGIQRMWERFRTPFLAADE